MSVTWEHSEDIVLQTSWAICLTVMPNEDEGEHDKKFVWGGLNNTVSVVGTGATESVKYHGHGASNQTRICQDASSNQTRTTGQEISPSRAQALRLRICQDASSNQTRITGQEISPSRAQALRLPRDVRAAS